MLRELHIRDLGVIDDARLELAPGLTVVTGETGAGKTMVVTGLALVLGGRADPALVRTGRSSAVVEAELELGAGHPALARAAEAGAECPDGELLLARTVAAEGRSRAHVGGRRAPITLLADLAEDLVALHGQADQWRLTRPSQHRAVVDAAGGPDLASARADVTALHDRWRTSRSELGSLLSDERERVQEIDRLTYQLEQIDAVDPSVHEEEDLTTLEGRLAHAEQLQVATATAHRMLSDPDAVHGSDVVALVAEATREIAGVAEHDPALQDLHARLVEIGVLVAEAGSDLGSYAGDVEVDPARLADVQSRRAAITDLTRRYGPTVADVLQHRGEARTRLLALRGADARIAALEEEVQRTESELARAVDRLSALRSEAGSRLAEQVARELTALAMPKAVVEIHVGDDLADDKDTSPGSLETPDGRRLRVTADGADVVEIRVAVNPGTPPRSVARAASGGELSRIMLALEVATSTDAQTESPTFVFDEVDAGVGGRSGLDVGARLARLAVTSQVVVVTHLAQVAAHADRHLVVRKSDDGQVTSSDIVPVDGEERWRELARMMGGGDTDAALEHARELLEACQGGAA